MTLWIESQYLNLQKSQIIDIAFLRLHELKKLQRTVEMYLNICTSVFIEDELNLRTTIEVLNVIKSPSGHVVSAKWNIHRLSWGSCHCYRNHQQQPHHHNPCLMRSHFSQRRKIREKDRETSVGMGSEMVGFK